MLCGLRAVWLACTVSDGRLGVHASPALGPSDVNAQACAGAAPLHPQARNARMAFGQKDIQAFRVKIVNDILAQRVD